MKKLTLILSTILLMSSTAAFARSKTSKVMGHKFNNSKDCKYGLNLLQYIANSEKDLRVEGSCKGSRLTYQWKVNYLATPTQKFKINYGSERDLRKEGKSAECDLDMRILRQMSGLNISYKATCYRENTYDHYGDSFSVNGGRFFIKGKVSLK